MSSYVPKQPHLFYDLLKQGKQVTSVTKGGYGDDYTEFYADGERLNLDIVDVIEAEDLRVAEDKHGYFLTEGAMLAYRLVHTQLFDAELLLQRLIDIASYVYFAEFAGSTIKQLRPLIESLRIEQQRAIDQLEPEERKRWFGE